MHRNGKNTVLFPSLAELELAAQYAALAEEFLHATAPGDLRKLLSSIDSATSSIDANLHQYAAVRLKKHQQEVSNLELSRTKLSGAISSSSDLTGVFLAANDLGNSLTYKIKSLDQEISNVNKTLDFVTNVQLLRNNINQANYAIEHRNWELAAQCINTINNKLDKLLVTGKFASVVIPSEDIPELPYSTVEKWVQLLTAKFEKGFTEAAHNRDVSLLTKYFQLFPLINQEVVGLNCYSKFICLIITDTSRRLIGSTTGENANQPGLYGTITMQLFESVSMMLSQHGPLIRKYYGETYPNATTYVVSKIQREIDSQVGLISDTFYDNNRIDKVLQDIKLHKFPVLLKRFATSGGIEHENEGPEELYDHDVVSVVEIGDLINDLTSILHHWALYCKFITVKYFSEASDTDPLKLPQLVLESNFTKKIHSKLLPAFEQLYNFYFRRSLEKAITIEEVPLLDPYLIPSQTAVSPESAPVSSVIEDVALVLNTTLRNVLDTAQPSTVKKFVTESFHVIQNDLINGFFVKSLNDNQPRYNQTLAMISHSSVLSSVTSPGSSRSHTPVPESVTGGMGFFKGASSALGNVVGTGTAVVSGATSAANNIKLSNFVVYLNTVAMGQEYVNKVFENVTNSATLSLKNNFPFGKDNEKIYNILKSEFVEPFTSITNKIIHDSLINFYNHSVKNKLLGLINECFPDTESNYVVYSANALNDTAHMLQFSQSWQALTRPYKQTFHDSLVFSKLLRLLVVNLANLTEKKLTSVLKSFNINELGSLKLEKDLSFIINEVCEDNYELREKFVRVTQLVLLVGMDDEEYDLSIQSHGSNGEGANEDENNDEVMGINWVLTPLERKQARKFRI